MLEQEVNSWDEFSKFLSSKGLFRITPGLGRISRSLESLKSKRLPFPVVQIIGTNGKGSTTTMLASIAASFGLKAGIYTSPHFVSVKERVRINQNQLPTDLWLKYANILNKSGQGYDLSYFEWLTSFAALVFKEENVDIAFFEAGLGGTWDATTALKTDLVIYTPIDIDHENILGKTIAEIAKDKAGAIHKNCVVITCKQKKEAQDKLLEQSRAANVPIIISPKKPPKVISLELKGSHQQSNAALALCAWKVLEATYLNSKNFYSSQNTLKTVKQNLNKLEAQDNNQALNNFLSVSEFKLNELKIGQPQIKPAQVKLSDANQAVFVKPNKNILKKFYYSWAEIDPIKSKEAEGLKNAWIPGRLQLIANTKSNRLSEIPFNLFNKILLDGSHNAHGISALQKFISSKNFEADVCIFSCLADKNIQEIIPYIKAIKSKICFIPPVKDNPRTIEPENLVKILGKGFVACNSLEEALGLAANYIKGGHVLNKGAKKDYSLLIFGSLYLLGEVYSLYPKFLDANNI